ncbi:MAG: hypothetical protein H7263_16030 [Candidatus Sericytochromatia bacterium]|nr:hypothetical protein [Candidatus Sericytochromatia bacterium]
MFEFLEVDQSEHKEQVYYQEIIKEIPENQHLTLSDLIIISPNKKILSCLSKKILDKYSLIPLFSVLANARPNLPRHLLNDFRGGIQGKKQIVLYIAMTNPFDNHILNIIRSITDYTVVSIPVKKIDADIFLKNEYNKIVYPQSLPKIENNGNIFFKAFKENIFYIMFFIIILLGLIAIKYFIHI